MAGFIQFNQRLIKSIAGTLNNGITDMYLNRKAEKVKKEAVRYLNVHTHGTGQLARSIYKMKSKTSSGAPAYLVGSALDYALPVHEGSGGPGGRQYTIARNVPNLYFYWTKMNRYVRAPKVRYTYRKPQPYLTTALDIVFR
jgi:phage gpG-like protein